MGMDNQDSFRTGTLPWLAGSAVLTAALYYSILGWHAEKTHSPGGGECTGPYEAWQVIAVAVGMALVVGTAAWQGHAWAAVPPSVVCLTLLWSADAATVDDVCNVGASLWPIGSILLFVGSAAGLGIVAVLVGYGRKILRRPSARGTSATLPH